MDKSYSAYFFRVNDEPRLADEVFHFRKRLFVDIYQWDLECDKDKEQDAFDTPYTVYAALYHEKTMIGTFRGIRTDRPYLSVWAFPQLAQDRAYPRRHDIWEISRFGVLSKGRSERYAFLNYALMFHFAHGVGARSLVATAEPSYERFLSQIGIESRRYGSPQTIGHSLSGKPITALAGEIPVSAQTGTRFERIMRSLENVEIVDASDVFGPSRLSA